jgi:N-glycosylase/DNA lyase
MESTIEQVRRQLNKLPRAEWDRLAVQSGVPRSTLEKYAYGVTKRASFDVVVRLAKALRKRNGSNGGRS